MANDEELAELLADQPESPSRSRGPRVSEWDGVREDLAALNDRVDRLTTVLIKVNGGKPPKFQPHPRPVTAGDRMHDRRVIKKNKSLMDKLSSLPRR